MVTAFISLLARLSLFVVSLINFLFFTQRLVLYLTVSVILDSVATILHRVDYENQRSDYYIGFCKFSGLAEYCTGWMKLMATASITLYIIVWITFNWRTDRLE